MTATLSGSVQTERGSRAETFAQMGLAPVPSRTRAVTTIVAALALIAGLAFTVRALDDSSGGYAGAVYPSQTLQLTFPGAAPLERIYVHAGERVARGEVLATQDSPGLSALVTLAEAAVTADALRVTALKQAPLGTPPTTDSRQVAAAEAALAGARLELATDQQRLAEAVLRSPMAGLVQAVEGAPGDLAGPSGVRLNGTQPAILDTPSFAFVPSNGASAPVPSSTSFVPVVTVRVGNAWQVVARVPESSVASIRPGTKGTFTFDPLGGATLRCTVVSVSASPSDAGGQVAYDVILSVQGAPPRGVLPGMSGTLSLR